MTGRELFAVSVLLVAACGGGAVGEGGTTSAAADSGAPEAVADPPDAGGRDAQDRADASRDSGSDPETDAAVPHEAGALPPSCVGLALACGPSGTSDCCPSLRVPGGSFDRSNDPAAPATVAPFRLDRFEVTVGRFRRFVAAGGGTRALVLGAGRGASASVPGSGWQPSWDAELEQDTASLTAGLRSGPGATWTDTAGANEALPINHVVWLEAFAFCAWDGGRLPTQAELSFAAVGGSEQRVYPWSVPSASSTIDPSYASYSCLGDGLAACADADLRRVGSYSPKGDGRFGQADLVGNVAEWALDEWSTAWLLPCTDCARVQADPYAFRATLGGDYRTDPLDLTGNKRRDLSAFYRWDRQGFRCARSP